MEVKVCFEINSSTDDLKYRTFHLGTERDTEADRSLKTLLNCCVNPKCCHYRINSIQMDGAEARKFKIDVENMQELSIHRYGFCYTLNALFNEIATKSVKEEKQRIKRRKKIQTQNWRKFYPCAAGEYKDAHINTIVHDFR